MTSFTTVGCGHVRQRFSGRGSRRCMAPTGCTRTQYFVVIHLQHRLPLPGWPAGMASSAIVSRTWVCRRLERLDIRITANVATHTRPLHLGMIYQVWDPVGIRLVARIA